MSTRSTQRPIPVRCKSSLVIRAIATGAGSYSIGKRWQYVPTLNAFIGFTETNREAYALRLSVDAPPPGGDADFATRCAAAGVLKCWGFNDTTSDIVQGVNLAPDG